MYNNLSLVNPMAQPKRRDFEMDSAEEENGRRSVGDSSVGALPRPQHPLGSFGLGKPALEKGPHLGDNFRRKYLPSRDTQRRPEAGKFRRAPE